MTFTVSESNCSTSYAWGYPNIVKVNSARWIKKATTKGECEAYGKKCVGTPKSTTYLTSK